MKTKNAAYHIIYGVMLALSVCIVIYLALNFNYPSISDTEFSYETVFDTGWHTADSPEEINIEKLQKLECAVPYEEFSIFNTLPEDMSGGSTLFFRSKNIFFSVYMDGELVYEPQVNESIFYNRSMGTH